MGKLLYLNEDARSSTFAIDNASFDPDLVGFYELRIYRETEAVSEDRADILEGYDQELLHAEVRRDHCLSNHQFRVALRKCLQRFCEENYGVK